jgi:hypothetical protein
VEARARLFDFFLSIVVFDPRAQPTHCAISPAPVNLARTAAQIRPRAAAIARFLLMVAFVCSAQSQACSAIRYLDGDLAIY